MRMLVGADVPRDPNSGAAGTVYWTNEALRELGHDVDEIWAPDLKRRIAHGNLHYLLELPYQYRKAVADRCAIRSYDIIQLSQPHAYLAAKYHKRSKRPGIIINRSHGVEPMVNLILDYWHKALKQQEPAMPRRIASRILRKLLNRHFILASRYFDGFIVGAADNADYLIERLKVPRHKVAVIAEAISSPFLTQNPKVLTRQRMNRLLSVSQYSFVKGTVILAKVISETLRCNSELSFTWITSENSPDLEKSCFPRDLQNRIQILRRNMTQKELMDVYDQHGIFVFTSFFEGFGKAPLEAMSRGLCVVSSSVGGMRDYIVDGINGILTTPGDIQAMKAGILALTSDIKKAIMMGAKARQDAGELRES